MLPPCTKVHAHDALVRTRASSQSLWQKQHRPNDQAEVNERNRLLLDAEKARKEVALVEKRRQVGTMAQIRIATQVDYIHPSR